MSNATVANIQIHANLIEHYLYTQDAPIAPGPANRFVSVFDGSLSHLLTVDSSGQMLHFMPDTSSQSGWRTTTVPVPVPSGAQEMFSITAFFASGTLHAIVLFEVPGGYATTWMTRTGPGQWSQANVTFEASSLLSLVSQLSSYIDAAGNPYLYGVVPPCLGDLQTQDTSYPDSAQFYILFFDQTQNAWDILYQQSLTGMHAMGATKFRIIVGDGYAGYPIELVWTDPYNVTFAGAFINPAQGGLSLSSYSRWRRIEILTISTAVTRILPFPGQSWPDCVLVLSEEGALYVVNPDVSVNQAVFPINSEDGPSSVAAVCLSEINGANGQVALFAIEAGTNSLWIARQDGGVQTPTFGSWANLGNLAEAIASPEIVNGGAEVYFADYPGLNVFHLAQNPTDGVWVSRKIAAPVDPSDSSGTPQKISAIMMHATAVDASANPVPSAEISVTSDQWANIIVDELSYLPGPGATVSIQADATGNADIFYHATSLAMPIFTLTAGSAQNWCQADVVGQTTTPVSPSSVANRLAGNDPTHPINQTTLTNANLLAPNSDPTDSIQKINQLGQAMLNQSGDAGTRLDLKASPATTPGLPDFSVGDIFGDVVNFFTNALDDLESVTVSITGDVVNFTINGVNYVLQTARQIAAGIQMIFAKIAEGLADIYTIIKEVIEFLEMLFHWGDILSTHRVFKACVNSFLDATEKSVGGIPPLVQAQISNLKANLKDAISALQNQVGSQTLNGYVNGLPPPPNSGASASSNVLDALSARDTYHQHLTRCRYVYSKTKNNFSFTPRPGASSAISIETVLNQVASSWNNGGVNFTQQTQEIQDFITGKISSFGDLFDLAIVDFLQVIEEFVLLLLDGLEDIVTAILGLIENLIEVFKDSVNASLNIPVISWLYKYVITGTILDPGDDLTILDVLCLIFAVPVTILYKLLYKDSAPFTSDDAGYFEQNGLAWPLDKLPGSALPGPKSAAATAVPAAYMTLGICGAFCNLFGGALAAGADTLAFQTVPPPGLTQCISYTAAIGGAIGQGLQAPWSLWTDSSREWTKADGLTTALWCASCIPVIYDLAFTFATGALARFTDELGPVLDTGAGFALEGFAVVTAVFQGLDTAEYSGWDVANSLVPQLQRPFRFFILAKDEEEYAAFALGALTTADVVVGFGSFLTELYASIFDWANTSNAAVAGHASPTAGTLGKAR